MRNLFIVSILITLSVTHVSKAQEPVLKYSLNADGDLQSAAFSSDGSLIAVVSGTKTDILLFESATGKSISNLTTGRDPSNYVGELNAWPNLMPRPGFMGLQFSPDGRLLAVAAQVTRDLRLWDLKTGKIFTTLSGVKALSSFAFSPDGKILALAMGTQGLKLIDIYNGKLLSGLWH